MDNTKTNLQSEVADALWMVLRECEDKSDLELEDVSTQHVVWQLANIAISFMRRATLSHPATQAGALQAVKRDAVSDQARLDYMYRSLRAIADRGRAGLGDSYPEILSLCITIRDMLIVATGPMRFDSSSILGDRALLRLWDSMPNEDVGQWERALAFVHLAREADAKLAATQPNAAEPERERSCAHGCNGCDDCTDYDDGEPNAAPAAEVVSRIAELEAQLAPYLEADAAQERFYARQQRVEKIADMLFPKFDSVAVRSGRKPGPLHWHEKSWWWNGVSVEWANSGGLDDNGGCVELSSYIGGGEVGTTEIDVPKAWLDADEDQWPILVDEYKKKKAQERAVAKAAQEAAEAQRQIEAAKATLRRLNGDAA